MKRDEKILRIADKVVRGLKPFCKKIEVVGSIRRHEKHFGDIDIVLIYKNKEKLEDFMKKKAKFVQGGEHESSWRIDKITIELYYTNEESWGAELLAYSSRKGSGIGLRSIAKRKGLKLNQYGLFKNGKKIAGRTEKEIYKALGRPYKKPEDR